MANQNVLAFRKAFPADCAIELRDAIIERLVVLGFAPSDLPALAKDTDMKRTIVNVLAPAPAHENPGQAVIREARAFKIRSLIEQAGNPQQKSKPTVSNFLVKAERRFGKLTADMTPDLSVLQLLAGDIATYIPLKVRRETAIDKDGVNQKQAIGLDGKPIWVMAGIGKEPTSFEELITALTPVLVGIEVLSETTLSVTTNYINKLTVLCTGHGPAATIQYDRAFRQRLVINASKLANLTGKSYCESVAECLCTGRDEELLVKAYASSCNLPPAKIPAKSSGTQSGGDGANRGATGDRDRKSSGSSSATQAPKRRNGTCPYSREECKLLKIKGCPFTPRQHSAQGDGKRTRTK
ncbi:hypothetical protein FOL47_002643 [Perkinsus chesapeaki]|uniref:Uncharacterized protein n=1 Tax=Perkinsus chesapeaki TaxID=330153 RepID=A0A7J6KQR3_PERCH|nr:hypothetical protein FOL47_002643 [Perkinsus chesapeaki]